MTRTEKHPYDTAPEIIFTPAPCPKCGACDMDEADSKCRPEETGERWCATDFDDNGVSVQPTPESVTRLDAWIENVMDWEQAQ